MLQLIVQIIIIFQNNTILIKNELPFLLFLYIFLIEFELKGKGNKPGNTRIFAILVICTGCQIFGENQTITLRQREWIHVRNERCI